MCVALLVPVCVWQYWYQYVCGITGTNMRVALLVPVCVWHYWYQYVCGITGTSTCMCVALLVPVCVWHYWYQYVCGITGTSMCVALLVPVCVWQYLVMYITELRACGRRVEALYECSGCVYVFAYIYESTLVVSRSTWHVLVPMNLLYVECNQLLSKTINPNFPSITHSPLPSCHAFVSLCSHPHHSLHITSSPHTYLTSHHPHLQPTSSLSLHIIGSVIVIYMMCKVSSPIILISHVHVYNYNFGHTVH